MTMTSKSIKAVGQWLSERGEGGKESDSNGYSFWGEENILELDGGDGRKTWWKYEN